jgi:predicted HicB family RNase H-like nuclease
MAIQRVQMRLDGELDAALVQRAAQEGVSFDGDYATAGFVELR